MNNILENINNLICETYDSDMVDSVNYLFKAIETGRLPGGDLLDKFGTSLGGGSDWLVNLWTTDDFKKVAKEVNLTPQQLTTLLKQLWDPNLPDNLKAKTAVDFIKHVHPPSVIDSSSELTKKATEAATEISSTALDQARKVKEYIPAFILTLLGLAIFRRKRNQMQQG